MVTELWTPVGQRKFLKVANLSFHAGTAGDRLLGFYVLPPRLIAVVYHVFLRNFRLEPLQDVDLQTTGKLWLMDDGVPSNFLLAVPEFLYICPAEWIG